MHASDLIEEFNAIRALSIKDPLFLPDDDQSPFLSPLLSLTVTPCPSLPMNLSPEPSSLLLAPSTVQSLLDSVLTEILYKCSSPSSMVKHSTANSFRQPLLLKQTILKLNIMQSLSQETDMSHSCSIQTPQSDIVWKTKTPQCWLTLHQLKEQVKEQTKKNVQQATAKKQWQSLLVPQAAIWQSAQECTASPPGQKTAAAIPQLKSEIELMAKQREYIKHFKAHHTQWQQQNKWYKCISTAQYYRKNRAAMALYLFIIHPTLYRQATNELKAMGQQLLNPLMASYAHIATNPSFIPTLQQHL
jgi:hypothetical protein